MKNVSAMLALVLGCAVGSYAWTNEVVWFGQVEEENLGFDEDVYKTLKRVKISGVKTDTWKNDARERYEVLEIQTYQSGFEEVVPGYRIHIVAEIIDKAKNTYLVEWTAQQPDGQDSEYIGEDFWQLYMKHGDLVQPKLNGYAVHYGIMDDQDGYIDGSDRYVVLAAEYDDVDSMEQLLARTTNTFSGEVFLKHYYLYDDDDEGETESVPDRPRNVK
jgi:hypothetical protein